MKRFQDKTAVVIGAGRPLGAAIARAFAREGAQVVLTHPSDDADEEGFAARTAPACDGALVLPCDVRDRESVRGVFQLAVRQHGTIDILVNAAGIDEAAGFDEITEQEWDDILDTNLRGVFVCCQEVLEHLGEGGRVVNVASRSASGGVASTTAEAGVRALTHCFARFVGGRGITVNGVAPESLTPESLDQIAETVLFCAASDNGYMTAQTITVPGAVEGSV